MSPLPDLDEELQAKVLAFVTEPRASTACLTWKEQLYKSLHLECQAFFHARLHQAGKVIFYYNAVRPLGEDFEESVGYNFDFALDGTYTMQWTRTFDAWSSQSEQHFGRWRLDLDQVLCETLEPTTATSDREVRYAAPGWIFRVPINDILEAKGSFFQPPAGSPAAPWELTARTGKYEDEATSPTYKGMWQPVQAAEATSQVPHAQFRPDARFVEIDGEMHEVSGDIVANWPEQDWVRLMRCRLRFGING
jgi:hypothetical protein